MAGEKYLIDTCIVVEYLRGNQKYASFLRNYNKLFIAGITKKELFRSRSMNRKEKLSLDNFLLNISIIYPDTKILYYYTILKFLFLNHSLEKEYADRLIAATALAKNLPLITLNIKHFSFIKGLKLISLKR